MDDTATTSSLHPRASFLGLPVELRLKIYSYIPGPFESQRSATIHKEQAVWDGMKCTINGHAEYDFVWDGRYKTNDLDILRVSKQTFSEAMPVIYGQLEIGPRFGRLPLYAYEYVRNVLVVCRWDVRYIPHTSEETTFDDRMEFSAVNFPRLEQLRMLFYLANPHRTLNDGAGIVRGRVRGATQLPHLHRVVVGAHGRESLESNGMIDATEQVCDWAVAGIKAEAAEEGKQIAVTKGMFLQEHCPVCKLGSR